jgi:hypothetical protein
MAATQTTQASLGEFSRFVDPSGVAVKEHTSV